MNELRKEADRSWWLRGAPLLPASLRDAWSDVPVPKWVTSDLGLADGATFSALKNVSQVPTGLAAERVRSFLCDFLASQLPTILDVRAVGRPWPLELDPTTVPWRIRTRNTLTNAMFFRHLDRLEELTFGDLSDMRQMGPAGILDFLCTLEAAEQAVAIPAHASDSSGDAGTSESTVGDLGYKAAVSLLDEDWADEVCQGDPRFAALLPIIPGTLYEAITRATSGLGEGHGNRSLLEALEAAAPLIRGEVEHIRGLPLENALEGLMISLLGSSDDRVMSLLVRMHWSGAPKGLTLEEAGRLSGVSRERIRQLEHRIHLRLASGRFYLPQVDRAMQALAKRSPMSADEASVLLQQEGISAAPFHPRSLLAVAKALRITPLVQLESRKGREVVIRGPISSSADRILAVAFRQLSQVGTTNVAEVMSEVQSTEGTVTESEVVQVLELYGGVRFTVGSWFWCPARPHCNLVTQATKMLSVISPIGVAVLREGLKRSSRFRRISNRRGRQVMMVPTRAALLEYFRGHPDFVVDDKDEIRYARPLDYRKELSPIEQALMAVLSESPTGILDRASFMDASIARGVNRNTFQVLSTYCPILESLGSGLWTLRGRQVDPATVEVLRRLSAERPREKRVIDHGWTPEGRLWLAIRLPTNPSDAMFYIPAVVNRVLASHEYTAFTETGEPCGRARIYENGNTTGYASFLHRAGADEGDILLAEFDLGARSVMLRLLNDEQLEELAEPSL